MIAAIRPHSWDFPLFLHVFGAMVLVGGLIAAALALMLSRRARLLPGLGFRLLLLVALPGYVLMRIGAEWIYSKESFSGNSDPSWIGVGYTTADGGALFLLVALIVGGVGARRARKGSGSRFTRVAGVLAAILVVAYGVTVWAMSAKPG